MVMRSRATDGGVRPNASKKGQIGPSTTVRASRGAGNRRHLASVLRQGRKMRILTPVWESSGESRLMAEKGAFGGTDCGKLITPAGNDLSVSRVTHDPHCLCGQRGVSYPEELGEYLQVDPPVQRLVIGVMSDERVFV
jgi:hypothetical protein